ncbi:hypothetical protein QE152_g6842 [Popillia japonica]|uniref:Uncharacterized protein n=1 Tax=Popillia japonica TaxID=7064 RepID=A0AAW1MH22_POPJA
MKETQRETVSLMIEKQTKTIDNLTMKETQRETVSASESSGRTTRSKSSTAEVSDESVKTYAKATSETQEKKTEQAKDVYEKPRADCKHSKKQNHRKYSNKYGIPSRKNIGDDIKVNKPRIIRGCRNNKN